MKPTRIFLCLFALMAVLGTRSAAAEPEFRALWVSSVYNLDYPSQKGLSADALQSEADALLDLAEDCGLNAIVLQVRPCADSLFPSAFFPWSEYLTGTQGLAPDEGFDPLAYFVEAGHARGLEIHAWCNPYRVTRSAAGSKEEALAPLADGHPAKKSPELVRFHSDGCLYFDPGLPAARQLILDGMLEIVEKYDVDGLHLDDYFYPGSEFDDAETFNAYGGAFDDVGDFRRDAVTQFVSALYQGVKALKPDVQVGISPFGIWANQSKNPLGSDTIGGQSYYDHYADSRGWVKAGIVDYIAPQLYWPTGAREGEYSELLRWWCDTVSGTGIKLYIGLGAYRLIDAEPGSPWEGTAEIESQIAQLCASDASGFLLFRAGSVRQNPALARLLARRFDSGGGSGPALSLFIGRPDGTIRTPLGAFYCTGLSDPSSPLTVNGQTVAARSESGFFGVLLPLKFGKNTFVFENAGLQEKRIIYRIPSIVLFSRQYPQAESRLPAGDVTLSCTAPQGSRVSAWIGGTSVALTAKEDGLYGAALTAAADLDEPSRVLYTAEKNGFVRVSFSRGMLSRLNDGEYLSFTAQTPNGDLCLTTDPQDGSGGFLQPGMSGIASAMDNGFLILPTMGCLRAEDANNIETIQQSDVQAVDLTHITQEEDERFHSIRFSCGHIPAASCRFESGRLILCAQPTRRAFLFESPLFSTVELEQDGLTAQYTLTLRSDLKIDGYQIDVDADGFVLRLKKHQTIQGGLPLAGLTVVVDAGHGGEALGALGADVDWPEKRFNLETALTLQKALEQAGADVIMTRESDVDLPLRERLNAALAQSPDVFLSLHSNSAADDTDISLLSGVGLYGKSTMTGALSQCIAAQLHSVGRETQIINDSRLYLCRAECTLALLIENEYIPSPFGLEILLSSIERDAFCNAVVQGLADYFAS